MGPTSESIRVLIVDDSAFMRKAIGSMIDRAVGIEVIGTARNGVEAVKMAGELQPDLITLDIEMPEMDGLTALRQIKRTCSAKVIMISSLTTEGSRVTLSALTRGADDFLAKAASHASLEIVNIETELITKIRALASAKRERRAARDPIRPELARAPVLEASDYDILLIGSSTGGPPVLEKLITALPEEFPLPVVIAQHMPALFTETMAHRLDDLSAVPVHHARNGTEAKRGHVYIAPGGEHTKIARRYGQGFRLSVSEEPAEEIFRPSVNELFRTAADVSGRRVLAIVLTGMGHDGLEGGRALREKGAMLLGQDRDSCVVYGMPKAVAEAGLIEAALTPEAIQGLLRSLTPARQPAAPSSQRSDLLERLRRRSEERAQERERRSQGKKPFRRSA